MTEARWQETPIARDHDRNGFDCAQPQLNGWLRRFARQTHESGGAKTFVAVKPDAPGRILGFDSLSPASIDYARTPEVAKKGLGRYEVPVFRLARLAINRDEQGQGLGGHLLLRAGKRALGVAQQVGGVGLLIDAKDDQVAGWYRKSGAVPLGDTPLSLILPFSTLIKALVRVEEEPR